jgi:hypothetical protein
MINFFKTLIRPDQEEDPERTVVARAANILQVGEFQLMQLAYHDWYGQELPAALCDQLFQAYMLRDEIPTWARHYARRIIDFEDRGLIDCNDAYYHRYDREYVTHVPQGVRQFTVVSVFLVSILVLGVVIGELAAGEGTSMLPPYFDQRDFPTSQPAP